MNLVIDTGNTKTKIGVFKSSQLIFEDNYSVISKDILEDVFQQFSIQHSIHSFVADRDKEIDSFLSKQCDHIVFSHRTSVPMRILYNTPETLGLDRIAVVVGAGTIFPENNVLVIDAGSAITYELLTSKAEYIGGNISPGLSMRFKALHTFTDKLPHLQSEEEFPEFGKSTKEAILAGVQRGIIAEVDAYINECKVKYPALKVIVTGGDAFFFDKRLKNRIFAEPSLVLKGLNRIIEHNV